MANAKAWYLYRIESASKSYSTIWPSWNWKNYDWKSYCKLSFSHIFLNKCELFNK